MRGKVMYKFKILVLSSVLGLSFMLILYSYQRYVLD